MLTEVKCGKTHVQLFGWNPANIAETICIATVRNEFAEAVKAAIEAQLSPLANRGQSTISTEDSCKQK